MDVIYRDLSYISTFTAASDELRYHQLGTAAVCNRRLADTGDHGCKISGWSGRTEPPALYAYYADGTNRYSFVLEFGNQKYKRVLRHAFDPSDSFPWYIRCPGSCCLLCIF